MSSRCLCPGAAPCGGGGGPAGVRSGLLPLPPEEVKEPCPVLPLLPRVPPLLLPGVGGIVTHQSRGWVLQLLGGGPRRHCSSHLAAAMGCQQDLPGALLLLQLQSEEQGAP
jgi:hypothetical protein